MGLPKLVEVVGRAPPLVGVGVRNGAVVRVGVGVGLGKLFCFS